ncbi:MAG: amino acid permease [Marinilabiliaceae bacterium]|nr:amino acid permease [Marinilabiliaceae bacterium]
MAKQLKRELSLLEVICVSAGVMISSGLFILPAIAFTKTGAAMILSYAIASLLMVPTVLTISELVTAMPVTGGIYVFADRSMGPLMGTIGGLTAWISLAFKSAFSLLAMGIFVLLLKPDVPDLQIKMIGVLWCLFFTYINIKGVKFSSRFQTLAVLVLVLFLLVYVVIGASSIEVERYFPFAPMGTGSVFTTAGFIFIAFAGTTKVTTIAGEVKNPGRNLPLGIFYSWGIVSVLYVMVVFVTVGILDPLELSNTFTPISVGGGKIMGQFGLVIMTLAALLAFISTGNAGLLAASRNPMAMGRDDLLPAFFSKISAKGTPAIAILITSGMMIAVILFLDLETFVKTASAMKLVLFIIANLSLIFMREANIHHYRPKYIAPFYPWAQIIGIGSYLLLLFQMGTVPLIMVTVFIMSGIGWYFLYAHGKIKREYAILHIVERITGIRYTDRLLEEELREILIERDEINREWFELLIEQVPVIDFKTPTSADEVADRASKQLTKKLKLPRQKMYQQLSTRLKDADSIVTPGTACIAIKIPGRRKFELLMVRCNKGCSLANDVSLINGLFIIIFSADEWNYQLHALSRIINIVRQREFRDQWMGAADNHEIHALMKSLNSE